MLQLNWKAAATVATGATALAGWLATPPAPAHEPERTAATARPAAATVSLEHEAARLAARIRATTAYEQPNRNPFRFPLVAPPGRTATAETLAAAHAAPVVPPQPVFPFRLAGTASDAADSTTVRTAVLSSDTLGLVLARVGDVVAGSYRVERIEDDAVEVADVRDGRVIRLTFRP